MPIYKHIESRLEQEIRDFSSNDNVYSLKAAYEAGLLKVQKYVTLTTESDYHLLGTGASPSSIVYGESDFY